MLGFLTQRSCLQVKTVRKKTVIAQLKQTNECAINRVLKQRYNQGKLEKFENRTRKCIAGKQLTNLQN